MKKIIAVLVVAVAGFFVAQHLAKGKLGGGDLTPEQRVVQSLDERIDTAGRRIAQASRAAGMSGIDSSSEAESALRDLERIESEIESLRRKATSQEIRSECDRLMSKVESTRR